MEGTSWFSAAKNGSAAAIRQKLRSSDGAADRRFPRAACALLLAVMPDFGLRAPAVLEAAPPRAIIDGPASVRAPGQKLVLRAADSTRFLAKGYRWTIHPEIKGYEQLTVIDEGRAVLIHTLPGRYVVTLTVAGSPQTDGSIEIDSVTHELEIPGSAPCPPPEPQPVPPGPLPEPLPPEPPTPQPPAPEPPAPEPPRPTPIPVGEFGIAPKVADIVARIDAADRTATAQRLAASVDALAAEVAAGTVTNVTTVLTRIGTALKELPEPWQAAAPQFSSVLQLTYEQHKSRRLGLTSVGGFRDAAGWSQLLRECGVGARAAR